MGAAVSCTISGTGTVADTGWGWWFRNAAAAAATYSYNWSLTADVTSTGAGPMPAAPPNPTKFAAGPTGIAWPANAPSVVGGLGSTASATQGGTSTVNVGKAWNTYSVTSNVSATTAAVANGQASATSSVLDPWEVAAWPHLGLPQMMIVNLTPQALLVPASAGRAGLSLHGDFGEIAMRLDGPGNAPACDVRLKPDWQVWIDLPFPDASPFLPQPGPPATPDDLKRLFLDQHDPAAPVWCWRRPAPVLTFARPIAAGSTETLAVGVSATDEDGSEERGRRQERRK